MKQYFKSNWLLIGILLLAFFFKFWQINTLPGGLFPDEAANGLDVNSILKGDVAPFYERGNGREALFFYFLAGAVALFGRSPFSHHIVSAGFGFAEVLLTYFLTKRMFGKRVGLLASFFMAVSSYAVTISRTAFRANTIPFFTTLTLLFLVKFFQSRDTKSKLYSAFFAGISFGLGFYTYISYRMMVPLLFIFALLLLIGFRDKVIPLFKQYFKYKVVFSLGFLISFAWLGYYFMTHTGSFVGRAGQVSVFSPDLNHGDLIGTVMDVFKKTILSFFTVGDLNWRHNVSGFPFLSPFISPFFALGLIVFSLAVLKLLKEVWQKTINPQTWYMALVAVWFWFMMVPELTTAEGIPHGLRLIGVIPPIFILSAWGVAWAWDKIARAEYFASPASIGGANTKTAFAAIFLSLILLYNFYAYFVVAANSSEYYYSFRSDLTTVSDYLNKRNQKDKTYLSLDAFSVQTVEYLTTEKIQPYILTIPEKTFEVKLKKGDQMVFTQSTIFDSNKFLQFHPDAILVEEKYNKWGETVMLVFELP